jgi:hypothetical protein
MKRNSFETLPRVRRESARRNPSVGLFVLAALVSAGSISGVCEAQELGEERVTLRGFGTLGMTTQDIDSVQFRRTFAQPRGVEGGKPEFYTDSIAGVQVDAKVNQKFNVMAQGVSHLRADGSWSLRLSQAFVRYSPDESLVLRAGRLGYDIYLLAESRQVGYSYLALRPPPEFYGRVTNDQIDGADIAYTRRVGRGLVRARIFGGGAAGETAFVDGSHVNTDGNLFGACFDYLYQGWTARVAMIHFEYDANPRIAPLVTALRMTGVPESVAIADELDHPVLSSNGMQLGVAYDEGPMQAQLLYGIVKSGSIAGPAFENVYALFGYRLQQFTPFASFASSRDRDSPRSTGLPAIPMFARLNGAVLDMQSRIRSTQHTASIGVRFDFASHFDLKLQIDHVSVRDSALMFDRRTPPGGPADFTVAAVAMDFVF